MIFALALSLLFFAGCDEDTVKEDVQQYQYEANEARLYIQEKCDVLPSDYMTTVYIKIAKCLKDLEEFQ